MTTETERAAGNGDWLHARIALDSARNHDAWCLSPFPAEDNGSRCTVEKGDRHRVDRNLDSGQRDTHDSEPVPVFDYRIHRVANHLVSDHLKHPL